MAAIDITISGVLYDKTQRTTQPVVLIGEASLTGLGVGGGPIQPPPFDPNAPRPTHPIAKPGDPWWGQDLHPAHPIVIPPDKPPEPVQPPIEWKAVWHPEEGWMVVGVPNVPHPTPSGQPPQAKK